jgi:hypothetical protein
MDANTVAEHSRPIFETLKTNYNTQLCKLIANRWKTVSICHDEHIVNVEDHNNFPDDIFTASYSLIDYRFKSVEKDGNPVVSVEFYFLNDEAVNTTPIPSWIPNQEEIRRNLGSIHVYFPHDDDFLYSGRMSVDIYQFKTTSKSLIPLYLEICELFDKVYKCSNLLICIDYSRDISGVDYSYMCKELSSKYDADDDYCSVCQMVIDGQKMICITDREYLTMKLSQSS